MPDKFPFRGHLRMDGWAGRHDHIVTVIGSTPKRWRIRNDSKYPLRLAGRWRWLPPGGVALVPLYSVSPAQGGDDA